MADLHELDATELATQLRRRQVTSRQVVEHFLRRIDTINGQLNAFITVTADNALAEADVADARLAQGDGPGFCGVPIAIKDLVPTAGVRTTMGSTLLTDNVPTEDAPAVTRLKQAGFISLGKTNTPEFGLSSYTDNDVLGPTVTPWDTTRNAGGSSGGAAAAVSAGLVPVALGSDGGGSIRIPASCCGVFGFKPSRGLVTQGWNPFVTDGPITRSVRDARALVEILAGHPIAEESADQRPIARWTTAYLPFAQASEAAVRAVDRATELLQRAGHSVVQIDNPWPPELEPAFNVVWSSAIAAAPIPPEADSLLRSNTRYWRERGAAQSATDLVTALNFLQATTDRVLAGLADYAGFLTPTLALPPQPVAWFNESGDPLEDHRRELLFTPYTALMNMSGQPAASLPLDSTDGLPIAVMLAGHRGADSAVLRWCAELEGSFRFSA